MDLSGNSLPHHAGTFSKLHSNHPYYQDYLASALGHSLHIHRLQREMPTGIVQKLVAVPVLQVMIESSNQSNSEAIKKQTNDELTIIESEAPENSTSELTDEDSQVMNGTQLKRKTN